MFNGFRTRGPSYLWAAWQRADSCLTRMTYLIQYLEPDTDNQLFARALKLRRRLTAEVDPELDPDGEKLFRASLAGTDTFEVHALIAMDGHRALGLAVIRMYHLETNTDKAEVEIEVDPEHRRRGVGSALLQRVLDAADTAGRTSIAGMNVNSEQAAAFWHAVGAEQKLIDRQSRLWLADTDEALMNEWVEQRHSRAADYRLEHYRGITPPHLRAAAAHLNTVMNDAPHDDLDWEADVWTEDDVVQLDKLIIGRGRERWTTIAFGPGDEPAGLTTSSPQLDTPRFAHQGNTAVDPTHRNRGIGRWLKADMWLRLRTDAPFVEAIDTDNAASNDPMLGINAAMGFKQLLDWSTWQADTASLRHCLEANSGPAASAAVAGG